MARVDYTLPGSGYMLTVQANRVAGVIGRKGQEMDEREAKDFLVQQAAEQAAIEGVPLSDLEKRMMHFTESGYVPEDPVKLNDEFEAEYDSDEYESKVSKLLHQAYRRLKKQDSASARRWSDAIRTLKRGDHYLLVLWGESGLELADKRPPYASLRVYGMAVLVSGVLVGLVFAVAAILRPYGFHWRGEKPPSTQQPMPLWAQRSLIGAMIGIYIWGILSLLSKPRRGGLPPLVSKLHAMIKKGR